MGGARRGDTGDVTYEFAKKLRTIKFERSKIDDSSPKRRFSTISRVARDNVALIQGFSEAI
jgi:hypothetical protein